MEIEGPSVKAVEETLTKLGIAKENVVTIDVSSIYDYYGYDGNNLADLNFEMEEK